MYPAVIKVLPGDDYLLSLVFDSGEHATFDMKQLLDYGVFRRLKDIEAFKRVRVVFDTVAWESGPDLDPEFLYAKCTFQSIASSQDQC